MKTEDQKQKEEETSLAVSRNLSAGIRAAILQALLNGMSSADMFGTLGLELARMCGSIEMLEAVCTATINTAKKVGMPQ